MSCCLYGTARLEGCFSLIYCGRGFPFVFREKPFGRAYNWANFANVKREQRPKGYPQRGGHRLPHKDKERDTEDQNRAGLQKIRIEL
mgnify:CR=1 FL=1